MYVKAEKFAQGGRGVGRLDDGRIVFINGLFPGEEAEISIVEEKKDYCIADILSLVVASPDRRPSPCPFSKECGGCPWIELSYDAQVRAKDGLIRELFSDIPGIRFEEPVTGPESGYRCRARFQYRINNGRASLGFCAESSNRNVEIGHCHIADSKLNALIGNPPRLNAWELKNRELSCISTDDGVLYDTGSGSDVGWITVGNLRLPVTTDVFFQSNLILLPSLVDYVVSQARGPLVMDLYSGVGTFSAFLEGKYGVTAVEINKHCLSLARKHLKNTSFFTSPVEKWNPKVRSVDTVIVDPPRVGLDKAVPQMIASWNPSRIIYVSCYAPTLHRDVKRLEELGYEPVSLRMFDFYPSTPHVETVILLSNLKSRQNSHISVDVDMDEYRRIKERKEN